MIDLESVRNVIDSTLEIKTASRELNDAVGLVCFYFHILHTIIYKISAPDDFSIDIYCSTARIDVFNKKKSHTNSICSNKESCICRHQSTNKTCLKCTINAYYSDATQIRVVSRYKYDAS